MSPSGQFRLFHVILGNSLRYGKVGILKYIKETKNTESLVAFFDLLIVFFWINLFVIYIKMSKDSCTKYYQKNKERLQKKTRERYQNLSKEEKDKEWQYCCQRYKNLSKDKKQRMVEYKKN